MEYSLLCAFVAGALLLVMQILVTANILLYKEDVKSSIGWIGLVWLAPVAGTIIYTVFGLNRVKRKALALRNSGPDILSQTIKTFEEIKDKIPQNFLQLIALGHKIHPQYFSLRNFVRPLRNGDEAYPLMCRMIENAQKEVLLQSYIFDNDAAGKMFVEAVKKAAARGASVRVLVDGVGLNYSRPTIQKELENIKGVDFGVFLPSRKPANLPFVNLRNHRKMLIVDGEAAVFGGMNIAQGNLVKSAPKEPICDVTFEVSGEVSEQMARVFLEDWLFAKKPSFRPLAFGKKHEPKGNVIARIIPDGPDSDAGKIEFMLLGALNCAQKKVIIATPYFLPQASVLNELEIAALRGVEVELILPAKSNIFGMDWAMAANFSRLLKRGVKIYRAKPPFDHSKFMTVDGTWCFMGSSNWDERSLRLNFECNIECFDKELASRLEALAEDKKRAARRLEFKKLPVLKRLRDNAFRLLTPYY